MTSDEKEKLKAILYELAVQINHIDCGLPSFWIEDIDKAIHDL